MSPSSIVTMHQTHLKIGIIQSFPLTADFSGNLRRVVQGYRECLDRGAELVVAPATALCGLAPMDLAGRRSFMAQTRDALNALAAELSDTPLLLGAWSSLLPDEAEARARVLTSFEVDPTERVESLTPASVVTPFLLCRDSVTELGDAELSDMLGRRVYVDINDNLTLLEEGERPDLIIHLATGAWHRRSRRREEERCRWEARHHHCPVVCCRAVGTAEGQVYGGSSIVCSSEGEVLMRLPAFQEMNAVADTVRAARRSAAEGSEQDEMAEAICRGIADSVHGRDYAGVCILGDLRHSALLAALCAKTIGPERVLCVSFDLSSGAASGVLRVPGVRRMQWDLEPLMQALPRELDELAREAARPRLAGALLSSLAEQEGLLLLSPLSRQELMTGQFTLYGESCGGLLPFGELYDHELAGLGARMGLAPAPDSEAEDREQRIALIIHEMANLNHSPGSLIHQAGHCYPEHEVRFVQRRMAAGEAGRRQLPPVLHLTPDCQQLYFPIRHRLND